MEMTRQMMALMANINRYPKKPALKGQDFIKLSYDKPEDKVTEFDDDNLEQRLKRLKELFPDNK